MINNPKWRINLKRVIQTKSKLICLDVNVVIPLVVDMEIKKHSNATVDEC